MNTKVAVLGGGGMATACTTLLTESSNVSVSMWVRNAENARDLQTHRENRRLLPGVPLSESVNVTSDIDEAVADCRISGRCDSDRVSQTGINVISSTSEK